MQPADRRARTDEIVFTASGSDLPALRANLSAMSGPDTHLIVPTAEHPAVPERASTLNRVHGTHVSTPHRQGASPT